MPPLIVLVLVVPKLAYIIDRTPRSARCQISGAAAPGDGAHIVHL